MGVHMPALWNADPGSPNRGSLPSTSGVLRCGAASDRNAAGTIKEAATWEEAAVHVKRRFFLHTDPIV